MSTTGARAAACMLAAVLASPLASAQTGAAADVGTPWRARVVYVVDGDSVWVRSQDGDARVRLRMDGIDAPEICQRFGPEARQALRALALHQSVRVTVRAYDGYGRAIASVVRLRDGVDVAARMVADGWARTDGFHGRRGRYESDEAQARHAGRGVFAEPDAESPAEFRRRHGPCAAAAG